MKRILVPLFLAVVLAAAGGAFLVYSRTVEPYRGYSDPVQYVDVPAGSGTRAIGDRLIAAGVVRDVATFRMALWLSGSARRLQAGEYRFDHPMTSVDVVEKIARGDVDAVMVTFPEGLTIAEMSKIFEARGLGPAADFVSAAADVSLVGALDPVATDLEGYLFPDTYPVPHRQAASRLVHQMLQRFEKVAGADLRAQAEGRGLSVRQWVTLASIVEKETARPDERPTVAAVYANRLRIDMPLQCDPTVIYALMRAHTYTGNITREDLGVDSPYNTYRYRGLPPGPIASPGKESLQAAVHPADVTYLYFVSRNDGSHEFARTLDEHNRNVHRFQVEYFREKRAGRAKGAGGAGR